MVVAVTFYYLHESEAYGLLVDPDLLTETDDQRELADAIRTAIHSPCLEAGASHAAMQSVFDRTETIPGSRTPYVVAVVQPPALVHYVVTVYEIE